MRPVDRIAQSSQRGATVLAGLRAVERLSQQQLAERAGVSRGTVFNVEHGKHTPSLATVCAITRALGYTDPSLVFPELFT